MSGRLVVVAGGGGVVAVEVGVRSVVALAGGRPCFAIGGVAAVAWVSAGAVALAVESGASGGSSSG
jgi:hypothetical protein